MTTRIDTVNIVELVSDDISGVTTYLENEEGNKEAEQHFRQCIIARGALDDEADPFIEDGYYESGTYQIFLTHSN